MASERIVHLRSLAEKLHAGFEVCFSHVLVVIAPERVSTFLTQVRAYDTSIKATSTVEDSMAHIKLSLGPRRTN